MRDIEEIKKEIVERLKPLEPMKIILFGSYAYGEPHEESDADIYVVTEDEFIPRDWREKSALYLRYSKRLRDLQKSVPIDLIVHTKKMHEKFVEMQSSFYRNDIAKGKILWQRPI